MEFRTWNQKKKFGESKMGDTDKIFENIMMEEPPRNRGRRRRYKGNKSNPGSQKQKQKPQPQPQADFGHPEMSHEEATLMAFMGIAKRVMGDLPTFNDEMLEVLNSILVTLDEGVRDQQLQKQYGSGYKNYRKN